MRIEGLNSIAARALVTALPEIVRAMPIEEHDPRPRPAPAPAAGGNPVPSVQMLVALAAADPAIERRRLAAVQADRGVRLLEMLHHDLLTGAPSVQRLHELAEWVHSAEVPEDASLAALLREIDLRVRVELAKFDVQA